MLQMVWPGNRTKFKVIGGTVSFEPVGVALKQEKSPHLERTSGVKQEMWGPA